MYELAALKSWTGALALGSPKLLFARISVPHYWIQTIWMFSPFFFILNFTSIFYGSPIVWSGIWSLQDTLVSVSHFLAAKHEHVTWFMSLSNVLDGAFCLNKHFICIITLKCHSWNKLWDMAGMRWQSGDVALALYRHCNFPSICIGLYFPLIIYLGIFDWLLLCPTGLISSDAHLYKLWPEVWDIWSLSLT